MSAATKALPNSEFWAHVQTAMEKARQRYPVNGRERRERQRLRMFTRELKTLLLPYPEYRDVNLVADRIEKCRGAEVRMGGIQ
jgi:hypothetical protein